MGIEAELKGAIRSAQQQLSLNRAIRQADPNKPKPPQLQQITYFIRIALFYNPPRV